MASCRFKGQVLQTTQHTSIFPPSILERCFSYSTFSLSKTMELQPIPGPRALPFLGNLLDLRNEEAPLRALEHLADIYGEIFKITVGGTTSIIVSSAELMKEVMDEKKFIKNAIPGLAKRKPNGLIVAGTLDPDWEQAHRILRPVSCKVYSEDVGRQLMRGYRRLGR